MYLTLALFALQGTNVHPQAHPQLLHHNTIHSVLHLPYAGLFAANSEENALGHIELGANAIVDNGRSILDGENISTNLIATNL